MPKSVSTTPVICPDLSSNGYLSNVLLWFGQDHVIWLKSDVGQTRKEPGTRLFVASVACSHALDICSAALKNLAIAVFLHKAAVFLLH